MPARAACGITGVLVLTRSGYSAAAQVKLNKAMSAPAAQGMGRDAVPKAAQVQRAKLERINELAAAKVLTVAQAEELRVHALLAEENHVLQLAGMHQLVQQGMLTPQHLEAAVQAVLAKARK